MKTPNRLPPGKAIKCPKCQKSFVPESEEKEAPAGGGTLKFADEPAAPKKKPTPAKPATGAKPPAKAEPPKPPSPPEKSPFADDDEDDESVKRGYGVIKETEEELKEAEKNKPKFTEVQDKFKKSARGPALSLCVMPSRALIVAGVLTSCIGIYFFIDGMWPLVFNDAPPDDEEFEEALLGMGMGVMAFMWGAVVCFGSSHMHEVDSYTWAMIGSVMGVVPFLVGIFGIMILRNPKVIAGFEEGLVGPDEEDEEDEKKKKEEEEDDDDDEGEDDDDEDDDEDEKPRKKGKGK
jgi:hypothetical protein